MAPFTLAVLAHPIVQAPMAGGPSTPALAAAVSTAGALGFLAAGYKAHEAVRADLEELRSLLPDGVPFGVNLFAPPGHGSGGDGVAAYAESLSSEVARTGVALGAPRWDDDGYAEKLELLSAEQIPVISFTFGCPSPEDVERLHRGDVAVWVTVTTSDEAVAASAAGADALIVQGVEAGGHRGGFDDAAPGDVGLLALLQLVRARVSDLPLVATGGVATGRAVAAVLAAGAAAAQLGTAFMLCPEAATAAAHRDALIRGEAPTALDARLHGPHRTRRRQPLPARALRRRPERLSGDPSPHGAHPYRRTGGRRRRRLSALGRSSLRTRRTAARSRARRPIGRGSPSRSRGRHRAPRLSGIARRVTSGAHGASRGPAGRMCSAGRLDRTRTRCVRREQRG